MKAFPTPTFSISEEARVTAIGGHEGMDLRDYFAAKAMQAYMCDIDMYWTPERFELAAKASYGLADAMMKARDQ